MLNNNAINSYELNFTNAVKEVGIGVVVSSFLSSQITKYALKTGLGEYFNFGNFGAFESGECNVGERIRYGNILIDHNIEDLSEKEIEIGSNPILDGGMIQNTRFAKKEIEINIKIFTDTKKSFEKEIRNIKKSLNAKGLKLLKREYDRISEVHVELQNVEIDKYNSKGTDVSISLLSLDPNFKKPLASTKAYRNISGNLDVSMVIDDTDIPPVLDVFLDIKQVTGTITTIKLELDGYKLEIDCNINAPDKVIFSGNQIQVFVGNTEITNFKGQFMPFSINQPKNVKCEFVGGTADLYSIYFSYDNIYL